MPPESLERTLAALLTTAWLLPLLGFIVELIGGGYKFGRRSKTSAYIAVGCIGTGFLCSLAALITWGTNTHWAALESTEAHAGEHAGDGHSKDEHAKDGHEKGDDPDHHSGNEHAGHDHGKTQEAEHVQTAFSGTYYNLAEFGPLVISLDWYIDSLTLVMFVMVTFIATCIHVFAIGYMSDELTEDYVDHEVHTSGGRHFHRLGRFYKFFSYLSLFSFSMLGLVLAGNIFQVFVFWELVGICSYLLIGFYVERKSASTAANKAFIMNRVGDFGFLIGLMILWTACGTFKFADHHVEDTAGHSHAVAGLFTMVRGHDGQLKTDHPDDPDVVYLHDVEGQVHYGDEPEDRPQIPYMLLIVAGLGIFAGCIGKSAQFPLHTWLPDAMEGPTPVSALVHSATMVAAGVYLTGRFYPVFTPEVLLCIAYVGCITLFLAATIAIVATDIKRVLAYSTISQLGYMMLGLGVAGWGAGLFHLITHAFFKSLMFLASGSVIVACHHVQEMPQMGGLRKKMPITAYTMLVGVIAIAGLAIPGTPIAFSGYHSKDAIVASALAFSNNNPLHFLLFVVPLITAGITAFYMFRLWFYTFAGEPRDKHVYDHAHESPWVMTVPLMLLAFFAAFCAVGGEGGFLYSMLKGSQPLGAEGTGVAVGQLGLSLPTHHQIHDVHAEAGLLALMAAVLGAVMAYLLYGIKIINPGEIKKQFSSVHTFLVEKWRFDDLYHVMFVKPVHVVGHWISLADKHILDRFLHGMCHLGVGISKWDRKFDETVVDGLVNMVGRVTASFGYSLRSIQTGRLRQYVMFIAVGVVGLFVLLFTLFPYI